MTALDHIKRALRQIGVIAENETPDAPQGEAALAALNGMLGGWEHEGIRLGLGTLALADTLPLPASHDDAISFNLAISLAAEYGADVRPAVAEGADRGKRSLQNIYLYAPELVADLALIRGARVRWH